MKDIWLQVGLVSESMLYVAFNLLTQAAHFNSFGFTQSGIESGVGVLENTVKPGN